MISDEWINVFDKKQALPDDLDDTVIMQLSTNNVQKQVHNTFKSYRNIGAYSTWVGVRREI